MISFSALLMLLGSSLAAPSFDLHPNVISEDPQYSIEKRTDIGAAGGDFTAAVAAAAIKQKEDNLGRVSAADDRIGISTIPVTIQDKTFYLTLDTGSPRL